MAKREQPEILQASVPRLAPKDMRPATKGDLEDVFFPLSSAPATTRGEGREPTRQELSQRYEFVRRDG